MSRKFIIFIIFFSIILCVGSYFINQQIFRSGKIELGVSASPQDAIITINGKLLKSNTIFLQPGNYMVSATKDGYYENRKLYEVNAQNNKIELSLVQKPESTIGTMVYSTDYNKVIDKYPIVKNLPYDSFLIKISYSPSSTLSSFSIDISAYEGYRKIAVNKIKGWGYQPAEYNIKFNDYKNPFAL